MIMRDPEITEYYTLVHSESKIFGFVCIQCNSSDTCRACLNNVFSEATNLL